MPDPPIPTLAAAVRRRLQAWPLLHRPLRGLVRRAMRHERLADWIDRVAEPERERPPSYARWIRLNDRLSAADRAAIRAAIPGLPQRPLFTVVMVAEAAHAPALRVAIEAVRRQLYPYWQLRIATPDVRLAPMLRRAAASDRRIAVVPAHGMGGLDAAPSRAAGGYVALLEADTILARHALFAVAAEIGAAPHADILYADEDTIDAGGHRSAPYFKPDFNAELLLGQDLIGALGIYRRTLVEAAGGLGDGSGPSRLYEFALRATEHTGAANIRHIPAVLAHRRRGGAADDTAARTAMQRAVVEHLGRIGTAAAVRPLAGQQPWMAVVRPRPDPAPLVSAIIPTRDGGALLRGCVEGLLRQTRYPALEVIIVDNGSRAPETLALLGALVADNRVRVLRDESPFNFAALNNRAAAVARGDILLLLNDDIAVIGPDWLDALVAQAMRPEIGAVGARLLYADGRVQHAGIVLGVGQDGVAAHLHAAAPRTARGYFGHLVLARDVSAVTAACMALRRAVFLEVGGFDAEALPVAYNDVDLCLKIRAAGYRVVWTPLAELHHLESATRGSDHAPDTAARFEREAETMRVRWGSLLAADPFYSPHLSRASSHYALAVRSRGRPWAVARHAPGEAHPNARADGGGGSAPPKPMVR